MILLMLAWLVVTPVQAKEGIRTVIYDAAQQAGVNTSLLSAICYIESAHRNVHNLSDGGSVSYGPCQVKLMTARQIGFKGPVSELLFPAVSTTLAAKYLRYQLDRYDNDWVKAISAYNAGSVRYLDDGRLINTRYVKKVFKAISEGR